MAPHEAMDIEWEPRPAVYDKDGKPFRRAAGFTRPVEMNMGSKYHPTSTKATPKGHPKTGGGRPGMTKKG